MLNKVHIQIVDNTLNGLVSSPERADDSFTNQFMAEELQRELDDDYPTMVSVEYIDLYLEDERNYSTIRSLVRKGDVSLPVILFNGIPRLQGGLIPEMIREEVDRIIGSGPVH